MALFVYITENCLDDARQHGLVREVEAARDWVEQTQSTSQFDHFPRPYIVKKKLGGRQGRLIADIRHVREHALVVFLAVMIRGDRAYQDEFAVDAKAYGDQHFGDLLSQENGERYIEERTKTAPPPAKPEPTDAEYGVLYTAFAHRQDQPAGDLVCETKEWVEQVAQDRISKQLTHLCLACLEALKMEPGLHLVPVAGKLGWGIWVLRRPDRLLLISISTETSVRESEQRARLVAEQLLGAGASAVLQSSRRAYPALILADDDLWIDLEKEPVANMALSPEESEVLESARRSEHSFPLFINGRAGSGKSTILQYLFADLLFFHLSSGGSREMAPPIYLTGNGELLRIARAFVERLLRSEATFTQQSGGLSVTDHRGVLDEAFQQFEPHLLSLVPADERTGRFARSQRVDFARFKRLWAERFGKDKRALKEFGPDISWHVIRSYIKGMSSESLLDPDDYGQLPQNQLTVTKEAFRSVWDRVWTNWYETLHEDVGLWDDQDLTRYVLDAGLAKPTYPAVVCDEAQDFTRLELELLLRLNLFSARTLAPQDIGRVPFAFAGDQFQTLNPTGFRWDAIKASFVEKFIFELDPSRRSGRVDLNYRELQFNYRSTHKIVRFGNLVQAMRAALFELPDLSPQTPWTSESGSFPVVWFRADDAAFWKKFKEQAGFVVLVPCNEGEEAEFVQADPILSQHIKTEDGIPVNVLSAARAKGCEYPAVVAYGFGTAKEADLASELEARAGGSTSDPNRSLPMQYFVNRLYVAVSRPKRRLIVVDCDEGFDRLWKFAQDQAAEVALLRLVRKGREIWGPTVEGMIVGNAEELARESAGDPLENAKAFEADGLVREDSFLLRQAAQAYRSAGDLARAKECGARALEFDGRYLEAGHAYFDAGFALPHGVECLWRAARPGWESLTELVSVQPAIQQEIECQFARAIVGKAKRKEVATLVGRFSTRLGEQAFLDRCLGDSTWKDALAALLLGYLDPRSGAETGDEVNGQVVAALDRIRQCGVAVPPSQCAIVYFAAKRYKDALQLWNEAGETGAPGYDVAKASATPYPERITSLVKLKSFQEIVDAYTASPDVPLSKEQSEAVVDALREGGRMEDAFTLGWDANANAAMCRLAAALFRQGHQAAAKRALHSSVVTLVRREQWEPLVTLVASSDFVPAEEWKESPLRGWVGSQKDPLLVTLIRALARSDEFPNAPKKSLGRLLEFLRRYLRVKDGSWRGSLSISEAGAAIERGGRFTDAIGFYEAVEKEKTSREDVKFARERWLVAKQRQLEHERLQKNSGKAREIEREMQEAMETLGLHDRSRLDPFPRLAPLEAATSEAIDRPDFAQTQTTAGSTPEVGAGYPDQLSLVVGPFRLDASRTHQRCNITHTREMTTAFLKAREAQCGGEVEFLRGLGGTWVCDSWSLTIRFLKSSKGEATADLTFDELGASVHLTF